MFSTVHKPFGLALLFVFAFGFKATAQFEDVSIFNLVSSSTSASWFGCGLSMADFNGDGWDDVTAAGSNGNVSLYLGGPDGLTEHMELEHDNEAKAVLWVDIENDGDLDLFVGVMNIGMFLYVQQEDGSLVEEAQLRGLPIYDGWQIRGFSARDYDNDRDLDIYVCSYHGVGEGEGFENFLFKNDGEGVFEDVTEFAGVGNELKHSFQGAWFDFNEDGLDDLWVINDRSVFINSLYQNMGDGTFFDIAGDVGAAAAIEAMSATLLDYDNDGDFDMYMTNIEDNPNMFLRNNGGFYYDVAELAGVASMQYGWGTCALDVDGDMLLDMMVATYRFPNSNPYDNHLYMNQGNGFVDAIEDWPNEQFQLYCLGRFDLDNDRCPDVLGHGNSAHAQVLRNTNGSDANRLTLDLVGTFSNSHAIGAVIQLHVNGGIMMRQVDAGCDYMTQHSYTQFFGLGEVSVVDSVTVSWPSGIDEVYYDVPADTALTWVEGTANASLEEFEVLCPWHPKGFSFNFPMDVTTVLWNGDTITGNSVMADTSGLYTFEASWWGGQYSWTQEWLVELEEEPQVDFIVQSPSCVEDSGLIWWAAPEAENLIWAQDTLSNVGELSGLLPGVDSLYWDYGAGCQVPFELSIEAADPLVLEWTVSHPLCFGDLGSAAASATGGTPPLDLIWGDADPLALLPGTWPLTAVDSLGCSIMEPLEVIEPELLVSQAGFDFTDVLDSAYVTLDVVGGTPPYEVTWMGPIEDSGWALAPSSLGWVVEDGHGCLSLGALSVPLNPLAGSLEVSHGLWNCYRTETNVVWSGHCCGISSVEVFDLHGRQLVNMTTNGCALDAVDLGTTSPVILRVTQKNGAVVVLTR